MPIVTFEYKDLLNDSLNLNKKFEEAYGKDGLGIVLVNGVPNVKEIRAALLPEAYKFANLDKSVQDKYVDKESTYSFGWSSGVEQFNGKVDNSKGSYYNNPVLDEPTKDEKLMKDIPFYCRPNIWPGKDCEGLEPAFKRAGKMLHEVACLLGKRIDALTKEKYPDYDMKSVEKTVKEGKCHKGRLLYYYPFSEKKTCEDEDNWCGWHLDSSSLTGLLKAQFVDGKTGKPVENDDPKAGLYIKDRSGKLVKGGTWREDQVAFQIGECSQILSAGRVMATPHCVQGSTTPGVGRCQFACFFQPSWDVKLSPPKEVDVKECEINDLPLDKQDFNFTDYSKIRFGIYYGKEEQK